MIVHFVISNEHWEYNNYKWCVKFHVHCQKQHTVFFLCWKINFQHVLTVSFGSFINFTIHRQNNYVYCYPWVKNTHNKLGKRKRKRWFDIVLSKIVLDSFRCDFEWNLISAQLQLKSQLQFGTNAYKIKHWHSHQQSSYSRKIRLPFSHRGNQGLIRIFHQPNAISISFPQFLFSSFFSVAFFPSLFALWIHN